MTETFDIVVAGGGHNSLVSAGYLAKAGLKVLVLEVNEVVGGNTMTKELTIPGYLHDPCASAHVLIQSSPTLRDNELELDRYGLEYIKPELAVTMPFEDGSNISIWKDIDRTVESFAKFSEKDAGAYLRLINEYDSIKRVFGRFRYTPIGYGPSLDEALAAEANGPYWMRRYRQSALEVVQEFFEHPNIQTFMLWLASLTIQPMARPLSGRLAYALANGRQYHSWATPVGGSIALPHALIAMIEDHDGVVLANKRVSELVIDNGRAVGVRTADGEEYRASRAVLSTIHIKHLIHMAPSDMWPEEFKQGIQQWKPGMTLFAAHYAVKEAPLFPVDDQYLPATGVGIAGSIENMIAAEHAFVDGELPPGSPVLLVMTSSVADPSRTPDDGHALKVVATLPYNLKEGGPERWDEIKQQVALDNLNYLRKFAPNLTDEYILGTHVESSLDLERWNDHNYQGSCHGGDLAPAQSGALRPVPGWASHRMPIPGLYQTGATTHPGGSVSAGPGRNAAWVLLDDLGISLEDIIANKSVKVN